MVTWATCLLPWQAWAAELGLLYDVKNPVHKWAIAMQHPKTQFSDPVMRAILKLDVDGMSLLCPE
jgi:hypothetical protein